MGQSVFPAPSAGTTSQLPVGHAVVIADGTVASGSSKTVTTTINPGTYSCMSNDGKVTFTFQPSGETVKPAAGWGITTKLVTTSQTSVAATTPAAWTMTQSNTTNSGNYGFTVFKYGNGRAVGVNLGAATTTHTTDGLNWTAGTVPASQNWNGVAFGNGVFVATAYGPSSTAASSTDGITWTSRGMANSQHWTPTWYGGGKFVVAAWGPSSTGNYSTDGISWSTSTMPNADWYAGGYGNGVHIAVSGNTATYTTSTDGITWTTRSFSSNINAYGVAFGNGVFVVTSGNSTTYATSTDAINWTYRTSANQNGQNITFGGGYFFWPDYDTANLYTSTDGVNWTTRTMPQSSGYNTCTYMENVNAFVALRNSQTSNQAVRVEAPSNSSFGVYGGIQTIS